MTTDITLRGVCLRVHYETQGDDLWLTRVEDAEAPEGQGTDLLPLLRELFRHDPAYRSVCHPFRSFEDVLLQAVEEAL